MLRHAFDSMGTRVLLLGPPGAGRWEEATRSVERIFESEHRRFTRFDRTSELSRVNAAPSRWLRVSQPFAEVLEVALAAARETGGLFDPTVLEAVEASGYERDFDEVGYRHSARRVRGVPTGGWSEVRLDGRRLWLPAGVRIDLGGIVKGWTVDRAGTAAGRQLPWALVSAGGDLRVVGAPPDGGIVVSIEEPHDPSEEIVRLFLSSGALATSSVTRRAWGPGLHHVIDPRTGLPAATRVLQATAWAESCARAEVLATEALLRGPAALSDIPGIVVTEAEVHCNLGAVAA